MKRGMPKFDEVVVQFLNARLVANGRVRKRVGIGWLSWVLATIAVNLVHLFRLQIIRCKIFVCDGPSGRDATSMLDFTEVFFPKSEQCGAVEFCVPADVVICTRVKSVAVFIQPLILCVIAVV